MNAMKMVLKINVNTTITMMTWSDWPAATVCKEKGRKKEEKGCGVITIEASRPLTWHSSSSQRNRQFTRPLHLKSADMQVASSQSYSSSSQLAAAAETSTRARRPRDQNEMEKERKVNEGPNQHRIQLVEDILQSSSTHPVCPEMQCTEYQTCC